MAAPRDVYMVNYFAITNGGYSMWPNYNGAQYQADMVTALGLGFNTIRINVAAYGTAFNFPSPTTPQLANWTDFCNRAKAVGMKLHVALFDYWSSYGQIAGAQTWAAAMIGATPDLTVVQAFELQNETQFAGTQSYSAGFDSGWPSSSTQYTTRGPVAVVWAQQLIPYIRSLAPGVPVVPCCTTYNGYNDLATIVAALKGTSLAPDWYEWHCYAGLGTHYQALQSALAVMDDPANMFIGETGANSAATSVYTASQAALVERQYLQAVRWASQQLNLPEPAPWILFDMNPSSQFSSGQTYGLIDVNGNDKPAAQLYRQIPPGQTVPPPELLNTAMYLTDSNGNVLPNHWRVYKGNSGNQPITAAMDASTPYQGQASALLTNSLATMSSDNPPALEVDPLNSPLISAGQAYNFSVALKGNGSTGTTRLIVSWYDNTSAYISGTNGTAINLTSSFTTSSLLSIAPANANYARLFVDVGYNNGQIWAAGPSWRMDGVHLASRAGHWLRQSSL